MREGHDGFGETYIGLPAVGKGNAQQVALDDIHVAGSDQFGLDGANDGVPSLPKCIGSISPSLLGVAAPDGRGSIVQIND